MVLFYIIAIVPVIIGGILWIKRKEVNWIEWLVGSAVAFAMAGLAHWAAISGMTTDVETWSGRVVQVEHHPLWVERWIEHHSQSYSCGTAKNPRTCTRRWTTVEYDTHPEHWEARINFGTIQENWKISYESYVQIRREFGNHFNEGSKQSYNHGGSHNSGDRNTYVTDNRTGVVRPVTTTRGFENRVKAAPSVFSFSKVATNVPVFNWPENRNPWASDRVVGTATKAISVTKWDRLNAELGPTKKVNLIIVGFDSQDARMGQFQQSKWVGGKKNDLVITYGGDFRKPAWCFVFGWTESELVKQNIQSEIIERGISTNIYAFIKDEVIKNYKIKDWSKFDYITIEPKPSYYGWYIFAVLLVQGGLWIFFHKNDVDKDSGESRFLGLRYGNTFRRY
jgi:hypothetical protein